MKMLSFLTLSLLISVSSCAHRKSCCKEKESCSKEQEQKSCCSKESKDCKDGHCKKEESKK